MIKTILYEWAVALGTSMDFRKGLRRSKPWGNSRGSGWREEAVETGGWIQNVGQESLVEFLELVRVSRSRGQRPTSTLVWRLGLSETNRWTERETDRQTDRQRVHNKTAGSNKIMMMMIVMMITMRMIIFNVLLCLYTRKQCRRSWCEPVELWHIIVTVSDSNVDNERRWSSWKSAVERRQHGRVPAHRLTIQTIQQPQSNVFWSVNLTYVQSTF